MIVHISNQQKSLKFSLTLVQPIIEQVLAAEGQTCDEVSICFVETSKISELHAQFFDDPTPTDCISFPMDEEAEFGYRILGEIFVCPETAIEYTLIHKGNPYEETTLYIVHGLLHLMGYRDIDEKDRAVMRQAEHRHMALLKELDLCLRLC